MDKERDNDDVQWVWGLVANIVDEHPYGKERKIVRGTKHFKPGTKVYCLKTHWGDGYESVPVIGRNRKGRLIEIVMRRDLIENFRLKKVFSPKVIEMMQRYSYDDWFHGRSRWFEGWGNSDKDKAEIELYLRWLNLTDEEDRRFHLLHDFDELALSIDFPNNPKTSFVASIRRVNRVKDAWVCHLNRLHRCNEEKWESCQEKEFAYRCDEPEIQLVWELLYSDNDSSDTCLIDLLSPTHEYEDYNQDLFNALVECKIHLWNATYGDVGVSPHYFEWSFNVRNGDREFTCKGTDSAPNELRNLVRMFQVYGYPINKDVISDFEMLRDAN